MLVPSIQPGPLGLPEVTNPPGIAVDAVTYALSADRTPPPNDSAFNSPVTFAPGRSSWVRAIVTATSSAGNRVLSEAPVVPLSDSGHVHYFEWSGLLGSRVSPTLKCLLFDGAGRDREVGVLLCNRFRRQASAYGGARGGRRDGDKVCRPDYPQRHPIGAYVAVGRHRPVVVPYGQLVRLSKDEGSRHVVGEFAEHRLKVAAVDYEHVKTSTRALKGTVPVHADLVVKLEPGWQRILEDEF